MHACVWTYTHKYTLNTHTHTHIHTVKISSVVILWKLTPSPGKLGDLGEVTAGHHQRGLSSPSLGPSCTTNLKKGEGERNKNSTLSETEDPPPPPHPMQVIKTPKFTLAEDVLDANRRRQTYRERQVAWSSQPVPCACGGWCASPQTSACPCLFPAHTHTRKYMPAYTHTNTHINTHHTHTHTIIKYRIWGLVQSSSVSTQFTHVKSKACTKQLCKHTHFTHVKSKACTKRLCEHIQFTHDRSKTFPSVHRSQE